MIQYHEVDLQGKTITRNLKADADIEVIKQYGKQRVSQKLISTFYLTEKKEKVKLPTSKPKQRVSERRKAHTKRDIARMNKWKKENTMSITVCIPLDLGKRFSKIVNLTGKTKPRVLRDLLEEYTEKYEKMGL